MDAPKLRLPFLDSSTGGACGFYGKLVVGERHIAWTLPLFDRMLDRRNELV